MNNHSLYELLPLPSNGCFYNEYVKVKHLSTEDELFILYPNNINNFNIKNILLQRCLIDIDVNKLLVGDRDIIFLHLLENAYGNSLSFIIDGDQYDTTTSELKIKDVKLNNIKINEFSFKLKNDDIIKFKLKTVEDEIDSFHLNKIDKLKKQIISINNDFDKTNISNYFKKLLLKDSIDFQNYIDTITPGIDSRIKVNDTYHNVPIDLSLFGITLENIDKFTESVDDEIFTLAHYGKGFPYSDIFKMTVLKRKNMISKLYDAKKKEKDMQEKEANDMKNRGKK